jgi:UDP-N-acetylmuramoylalanine--D-glutamate ligase
MMTPFEAAQERFANKKILIVGLGLLGGGVGDVRFFCDCNASVRATDIKTTEQLHDSIETLKNYTVSYTLGKHDNGDIDWADIIVKNPSIPDNNELITYAHSIHKPVIMRSSLFCELCKSTVIGITGTRGKTTTTTLIYEMVKKLSGKKVLLGGNIAGISDLELLKEIDHPESTIAVLELSSWQLQGFAHAKISPHMSVITNLYPDHLNQYKTIDEYYEDKQNIIAFQNSGDIAILNADCQLLHRWAKTAKSTIKWFSKSDLPKSVKLKIPGDHNLQNAAAAYQAGIHLGYQPGPIVTVLNNFSGVPFRMETIATKDGITYINDTTSTTPVAGVTALKASPNPPILICGGNDKNLPIEDFAYAINTRTKFVVFLPGTGTERIKPLIVSTLILGETESMEQAIKIAHDNAMQGDVILLSPGFTSFGLFNNEFDRGKQFNSCVLGH